MSFSGFEEVNQRFKQAMQDLRVSRTQKTIESILIAVRAAAAPMTPVDTSFLINSAYSKTWRTTSGWEGETGYGANYAQYVHNAPGTLLGTGKAWNPDAEPQFLKKAVDDVLNYDIDRIIKEQYMI